MPRQGQIIPEYLVPHVKTYINDNSTFEDAAATPNETGIRSLHVFASPKGEDGVLKVFNDHTKYLEEYGTPNYDLYGQPGYMPYAALVGGNSRCWCMRVMPDTATYANAIIVAKVKPVDTQTTIQEQEVDENGELKFDADGKPIMKDVPAIERKLHVKFESQTYATERVKTPAVLDEDGKVVTPAVMETVYLTDKDELAPYITGPLSESGDVDDYITYPIIAVCAKGRGAYGNSFRVRVTTDIASDADNGYRNYIFEVLDTDGGLVKKETHRVCLSNVAYIGNSSLYVEDVFADTDSGSNKLELVASPANIQKIVDLYKTNTGIFKKVEKEVTENVNGEEQITTVTEFVAVEPTDASDYTIDNFDLLFGNVIGSNSLKLDNYVIDAGIPFDSNDGAILLSGGDDSTFAADGTDRDTALNNAYKLAFEGKMDPAILSKRRTPCELIMDAGYDETVKSAIVALALKREDARCIIDAGYIDTIEQAEALATTTAYIDKWYISKECQHYKIKDPFNGKIIKVTTTYFLAANLPSHYTNYGNQTPFVGTRYAKLTGYVKNSLKPMIDADDLDVKESLYTNKVNFFECIAEDTYIRGTQGTSQKKWSDLSEENNAAVLLDMKRQVEEYVGSKLYNFAEPEDRALFQADVDRMFADYINTKVRSFSVIFDMNAFEEERSILHCYLSVVFRTMAKRGIIEIDINRRV